MVANESSALDVVPLDNFLFACFEFERTEVGLGRDLSKHVCRWPEVRQKASTPGSIKNRLVALVDWYISQFPVLASSAAVDYEVLH